MTDRVTKKQTVPIA